MASCAVHVKLAMPEYQNPSSHAVRWEHALPGQGVAVQRLIDQAQRYLYLCKQQLRPGLQQAQSYVTAQSTQH